MPKIVFNSVEVPVENRFLPHIKRYNDGSLGLDGVKVVVKGTRLYFKVLFWECVETLTALSVSLMEFVPVLKESDPWNAHKFLINRVIRVSKQQEKLHG